jgi:signal transduction histidine kinase
MCDRVVLRQAITNVIDNAIKYTPTGGRIKVRVTEDDDNAVLVVSDGGPGIPSDLIARIFDRFYRQSPTPLTGTGGGWGLGLAIARWAVEANGGTIGAISSSEGSEFRISLPLALLPPRSELESRRHAASDASTIVATRRPLSA